MPESNEPVQTQEATQTPLPAVQESAGTLMVPQVAEPVAAGDLDEKIPVVLGQPGRGARKYAVPPNTTVEQLCREINATLTNQEVWIGENKVQRDHVLQPRDVVFLVPIPKNAHNG